MVREPAAELSAADAALLADIRAAETLAELATVVGAAGDHEAYLEAKPVWATLRDRELGPLDAVAFPATTVTVTGMRFHIHGITHADTEAERAVCRDHVLTFLDRGAAVYCEQGIRKMYFADRPAVCELDDYRWAMATSRCRNGDPAVADLTHAPFTGFDEELSAVAARLREGLFALLEAGQDRYGERFAAALGDIAPDFLRSHEQLATGAGFESFVRTRAAAEDPAALASLARYYETTFLPQPLEREWLRRHDPELELFTHARNARMADYAVDAAAHADAEEVHLIVGAAHQPGIRYYLERHRDGERTLDGFTPVERGGRPSAL